MLQGLREEDFNGRVRRGLRQSGIPVECSKGEWGRGQHEFNIKYADAPTINAYKRYQAGSLAPTRIAWSHDNRTAGFRVVGRGNNLRIECRIPGADCNPYLALAAAIASGMDGIVNRIEPPPNFEGDIYAAERLPRVPQNLSEAQLTFRENDFVRQALGDAVVDHYAHFYEIEQASFDRAVSNWERRRYFERI